MSMTVTASHQAQVARWRPFVIALLLSLVTLLLLVALVSGATPQAATPARSHPVVMPGPPPASVLSLAPGSALASAALSRRSTVLGPQPVFKEPK